MSSETRPNRPSWLTETLILAVTPVLAYTFAYFHELTFLSLFDAPRSFATVDVMTLLAVGTLTAIIAFFVIAFFYDLVFGRDRAIVRQRSFVAIAAIDLAACLTLWLFLSGLSMFRENMWQAPLCLLVVLIGEDWQRRNSAGSPSQVGDWKLRAIATIVLGIALASSMAYLTAYGGEFYQVVNQNATLVILRKYGDRLICVKVDPTTRVPTKEFVVIPFGSDTTPLEVVKFGRLNITR